eukprot:539167_1
MTTEYYLLIAGTTESRATEYSDKTRDNGNYLNGITKDLANMEQWVHEQKSCVVQNVVRDMKYCSKSTVIDRIRKCARECKQKKGDQVVIYYTGHGECGTGNWCFYDGVVTLNQVLNAIGCEYHDTHPEITLYCDCCYSGNWVAQLKHIKVEQCVSIYSASWPGRIAFDTKDGGMRTLEWTNKKSAKNTNTKYCGGHKYNFGKFTMFYMHKDKVVKKTESNV